MKIKLFLVFFVILSSGTFSGKASSCIATFSYQIDSLNPFINTFLFHDLSSGEPNHWFWSFGDGATSTEQNVSHTYTTPGKYHVCLTISIVDTNGIQCEDSYCLEVSTPKYFSLGGQLYAGLYPINNPVSTGDSGIAFIYRINDKKRIPVDTLHFTQFGYFLFPNLLEGSYLIRAELTQSSTHYSDYFPTCYPNRLRWQDAIPVILTDSSNYISDIHLVPVHQVSAGPGKITGYVCAPDNSGNETRLANILVQLYQEDSTPLNFLFSDNTGNFSFENLPYGNYKLYPEQTGKYAKMVEVSLTESNPVKDSVKLELFSSEILGIYPDKLEGTKIGISFWPNPVSELLHVQFRSPEERIVQVDIFTETGALIKGFTVKINNGAVRIDLPVTFLSPGIYILNFRDQSGNFLKSAIFIKADHQTTF